MDDDINLLDTEDILIFCVRDYYSNLDYHSARVVNVKIILRRL